MSNFIRTIDKKKGRTLAPSPKPQEAPATPEVPKEPEEDER